MELLLALALPTIAGIFFLGQWLLSVLYKNPAFLQAVPALQIMAWILITQVFTNVLGQVLLASHRERVTLRIVIVDMLVTLAAGWPLISRFGLRGAAMTLLLSRIVACIQHYIPVSRLLSGIPFGEIVWKPVVAATCMAAYLALAAGQGSILAGVSATLIYGVVLLALTILACGGIRQFKARFAYAWSESLFGTHEEVRP
jgi:O-antigen/teichoic acid export membrane protein